ncbi:MAG TPA: pyridoxamine 5'-phosphate oxidase family protein [Ilumatobacteraceae bacterium]|nr:pyridoxamine 5'-phosphate oxidase family protein [Ilumatobacteraceae bacterium]
MAALSIPVENLSLSECWDLLRREVVGRLAVALADTPDIFPINYIVDHGSIVFRSAPGTKLAAAVLGCGVAFEIDGYDTVDTTAWSVVVKGVARRIESMKDYIEADDLPLFPWHAAPKPEIVRIEPEIVTGRRFHAVTRGSSR